VNRPGSNWVRSRGRILGVAILGLCLAGYWTYVHFVVPTSFYTTHYDPEMAYMLNSLSIFKSRPYAYYDHPGTPVEVLGSILLAMLRPVVHLGSQDFWVNQINHPELFLTLAHTVLTIGSIAALILITIRAIERSDWINELVAVAIPATYFAVQAPESFDSLVLWSHNSFNFLAGTTLLILLYRRLTSGRQLSASDVLLYGGLSGVLTAIQLYLATWVVGVAMACAVFEFLRVRRVLRAVGVGIGVGLASLGGFFIATQPILHRYREFSWWVRGLIMHQGRYGHGASGITSWSQIVENLSILWRGGAVTLVSSGIVLTLVAIAVYHRRGWLAEQAGWWASTIGMTVQLVLTLAIIAKHPAGIYLLAPAAILPVLLAVALGALVQANQWGKWVSLTVSCVVLLVFFIGLRAAFQAQARRAGNLNSDDLEAAQVIESAARASGRDPASLLILWSYGTESPCYALRFGNRYTGGVFGDEIDQACPLDWTYEVSTDSAELPGGNAALADSNQWDILVTPKNDLPDDPGRYGEVIVPETGSQAYIVAKRPKE
jgi:hypothetical protein